MLQSKVDPLLGADRIAIDLFQVRVGRGQQDPLDHMISQH